MQAKIKVFVCNERGTGDSGTMGIERDPKDTGGMEKGPTLGKLFVFSAMVSVQKLEMRQKSSEKQMQPALESAPGRKRKAYYRSP